MEPSSDAIGQTSNDVDQTFASHMKGIAEIMERLEAIQQKIGPPDFEPIENNLKGALLKLFQACCPLSKNLSDDQIWEEHLKIRKLLDDDLIPKTSKVLECMKERNRENEIENLFEFMTKNGADISKIKLDLTKDSPVFVAKENIDPMTVFAKIPISLVITSENFTNHPALQNFMFKDPIMSSMQNVLLTYGLILEFYSFEKSKFYQHIKSLPEVYDSCPYFEIDDFKLLKGSVSFRDALNTWKSVVRQYAYFHLKILQNAESNQDAEFEELSNLTKYFSFEDYRWAAATVMAKSFLLPSFSGSNIGVLLIPLIDLCPHSDTITSLNFDSSEQAISISNGFEIVSGDTIKIFYGARTNNQFVLQHGFFYDENMHEFCLIRIPLKNTPLYQNKNQLLIKMGISEFNGIPIGSVNDDVWSGDVKGYMRIAEADDEELKKAMSLSPMELFQKITGPEPLSEKNEIAAKNLIKSIIQEKITVYRENFENESELLASGETSTKVKNIIKLKHKELSTFESFLSKLNEQDSKSQVDQQS